MNCKNNIPHLSDTALKEFLLNRGFSQGAYLSILKPSGAVCECYFSCRSKQKKKCILRSFHTFFCGSQNQSTVSTFPAWKEALYWFIDWWAWHAVYVISFWRPSLDEAVMLWPSAKCPTSALTRSPLQECCETTLRHWKNVTLWWSDA